MAGVGAIVGGLVAGAGSPEMAAVAKAAGATGLVVAGGNALNDVVDRRIDRGAHPGRPIPSGRLSARAAKVFVAISFAAALALGAWVSLALLGLVAVAEALLVAYEGIWKARGLVGNIVVALLVAATFIAGAVAVGTVTTPVGFLAGLAFLANVAREVWKDIEDIEHDVGRVTLARRWGPTRAGRLAQGLTIGAVVCSVVPLLVGFGGWAFAVLVGLADAAFLAAVFASSAARSQRIAKAAMVTALVAFALGGVL